MLYAPTYEIENMNTFFYENVYTTFQCRYSNPIYYYMFNSYNNIIEESKWVYDKPKGGAYYLPDDYYNNDIDDTRFLDISTKEDRIKYEKLKKQIGATVDHYFGVPSPITRPPKPITSRFDREYSPAPSVE